MIFISSEFTELVGACNRVIVMREGRLVGELEGEAITMPRSWSGATRHDAARPSHPEEERHE